MRRPSAAAGARARYDGGDPPVRDFGDALFRAVRPCRQRTPRLRQRVGANPARAILEVVGGQGPQKLVGELAAEIAAGRSKMAAVVGSEAISTMRAVLSGAKPATGRKPTAGRSRIAAPAMTGWST
jgi:hypothetical protein